MRCAFVPLMPNARHARARGRPFAGHGMRLGQQPYVPGRPVDVRRRLVGVQGLRRQLRAAAPATILITPATPGGGLRVADVRLDRAEPQRPVRRAVLAVRGQQRLRLDRVAERRAGAVRLDDVDVGRLEARVGQGVAG